MNMRKILAKPGKHFKWTTEADQEWEEMRNLLVSEAIVLSQPNFKKSFHIFVDASADSIGLVLLQTDGEEPSEGSSTKLNAGDKIPMKVIRYFSKVLVGAQKRWSTA